MRTTTIAGAALILIGAFFLIRGGTFTTQREVLDIAGVRVTAEERHPVEPWAAGLAVLAGVGLVIVGVRSKA